MTHRADTYDHRHPDTAQGKFWFLVREANLSMESDEKRREFWWGYLKGINRRYHGRNYAPRMHEELAGRKDQIGEGYRKGLSEEL